MGGGKFELCYLKCNYISHNPGKLKQLLEQKNTIPLSRGEDPSADGSGVWQINIK